MKLLRWQTISAVIVGLVVIVASVTALLLFDRILSRADKVEIASLVIHQYAPTQPKDARFQREVSLALDIQDDADGEIASQVEATYAKAQRFTKRANVVVRDSCQFDRERDISVMGVGISSIKMLESGLVEVKAGEAMCIMGMSGSTFILKKVEGKWTIWREQPDYIT